MKIKKKNRKFNKIKIVIETRKEADALWDIMESVSLSDNKDINDITLKISDWFSNEVRW